MIDKIRGKILDYFFEEMLIEAKSDGFMRLSAKEAGRVRNTNRFLSNSWLDEKLSIANKLNRQVYLVLIDKEKGLETRDFSKLFRKPFVSKEANKEAIEVLCEKNIIVIGSETVATHLQRLELLLSSEMYAVTKVFKKLQNKSGITSITFNNKEYDLKDSFMRTVLRMYFASMNMDAHMKSMNLTKSDFAILSILWLSQKPLDSETIRLRLISLVNIHRADIRKLMIVLHEKQYIVTTQKESTNQKGRSKLFMLSLKGHDCIDKFIKKVTQETTSTIYE